MKKLLLFIAICLSTASLIVANGVKKYALIIAIGDYPEETDWKDISSVNDVAILEPAFRKVGFNEIRKLINEEATKEGIIGAFEQLSSELKEGDQVIVHISSHGQQIWDNENRDEVDGYDEAIVAYGAPAFFSKDYNGDKHLRDEELGALLDKLRQKCGESGDVMVFIDACHSGTGTRGEAIVRGGVPAMAPPDWKAGQGIEKQASLFEEQAYGMGLKALAPMVVVSAARSDELNYEYNGFGSLSVAVQKVFSALKDGFTYRSFFALLIKEMSVIAPRQNPAIEGDIDRELFGGKYRLQENYYPLKSLDKNWVVLEGGELNGLFKGSEVALFPAGTINTAEKEALATGEIVGASATESNLQLEKSISGRATDYWAFITVKSFGEQRIALRLNKSGNKKLNKALEQQFENHPLIEVVKGKEPADFSLKLQSDELHLFDARSGALFNAANSPSAISTSPEQAKEEIETTIMAYAQGKFIKNVEMNDPGIRVQFELIPVSIQEGRIIDTLEDAEVYINGLMEVSEGQKLLVKITNHSTMPVYFNLLDIQPDGVINLLMPDPNENESASEFKIPANSSYLSNKYIEIFPPYGKEVFKIFASKKPIDFSAMHTNKGNQTRGTENEVEKLFGSTYQIGSRGGRTGSLSSGSGIQTVSQTFVIKKP